MLFLIKLAMLLLLKGVVRYQSSLENLPHRGRLSLGPAIRPYGVSASEMLVQWLGGSSNNRNCADADHDDQRRDHAVLNGGKPSSSRRKLRILANMTYTPDK